MARPRIPPEKDRRDRGPPPEQWVTCLDVRSEVVHEAVETNHVTASLNRKHAAATFQFHSGAEQVPAPSATSEERRQHYEEASLPAALEQAQRTFEQRREHYRQACAETAASPYFRPFTVNQPSFIQAYHIAFCPIAKTGTTLWRKILYSVRTNKVSWHLYLVATVFLSGHVNVPDLYLVARGFVSGHVYRIYTSRLEV